MSMIKTDNLIFEYAKHDEEGNVIGAYRAIDKTPGSCFKSFGKPF